MFWLGLTIGAVAGFAAFAALLVAIGRMFDKEFPKGPKKG